MRQLRTQGGQRASVPTLQCDNPDGGHGAFAPWPSPRILASSRRLAFIGAPEAFDVELDHSEHGLHRALRAGGIGAADIFWQRGGHDLPRYAVAIPEPAALFGLA